MAALATTCCYVLHVAGQATIRFLDPPAHVVDWLRDRYGALLGPDEGAPVDVTFRPHRPPEGAVRLAVDSLKLATCRDGRFLLVDGGDRAGQLPVSGEERELVCDPHLDPQLWGPFHIWLERVIDWQVARRSMVTLKGGAVTLPGGTIAIAAFQGSGKSSTILSLLAEATAYLAEDRLTLFEGAGGRTSVAAFPVPLRLSRGRHYQLPRHVLRQGLGPFDRRLLLVNRSLPSRAQAWLQNRWVPLDLKAAFPTLRFPGSAKLDLLVFLQPCQGGVIDVRSIDEEISALLARQLTALHHDRYIGPFHQLYASGFLTEEPWPPVPRAEKLEQVGALVSGIPACLVRAPIGSPAEDVASALRKVLTAQMAR